MKKALLLRFMGVLALALFISSLVTYYFVGNQLLKNNIDHLNGTIRMVDYTLDYDGDIQMQVYKLHEISFDEEMRMTIMDKEGNVVADSKAPKVETMENHLMRMEVQEALAYGTGHSMRYSETLNTNMLYAAGISNSKAYIIRIALPYTNILDYMMIIFPMLLLGMCAAFLISVVIAARFTNTITKPLCTIAERMQGIRGNELTFSMETFQYEELNIIADTTLKLTKDIRDYIAKIEVEKKIRQEFFSNASHELKTPITSVKGYVELIEAGFITDEVTKKDFLARIRKETENMTDLINDILMISRLETKEAEVTFSQVRMSPLIKEVFESLEPMAMEYQVKLHSECEPLIIEASAKQLRELIMNLVSNGIKYNHLEGNVWVTIKRVEDDVLIEVKDDGMGISKESKERVFQRFYRVDKGRSKKMGGTGLGLSIVKHIVEFYGGSISLESTILKGSTFLARIPIDRTQEWVDK